MSGYAWVEDQGYPVDPVENPGDTNDFDYLHSIGRAFILPSGVLCIALDPDDPRNDHLYYDHKQSAYVMSTGRKRRWRNRKRYELAGWPYDGGFEVHHGGKKMRLLQVHTSDFDGVLRQLVESMQR